MCRSDPWCWSLYQYGRPSQWLKKEEKKTRWEEVQSFIRAFAMADVSEWKEKTKIRTGYIIDLKFGLDMCHKGLTNQQRVWVYVRYPTDLRRLESDGGGRRRERKLKPRILKCDWKVWSNVSILTGSCQEQDHTPIQISTYKFRYRHLLVQLHWHILLNKIAYLKWWRKLRWGSEEPNGILISYHTIEGSRDLVKIKSQETKKHVHLFVLLPCTASEQRWWVGWESSKSPYSNRPGNCAPSERVEVVAHSTEFE